MGNFVSIEVFQVPLEVTATKSLQIGAAGCQTQHKAKNNNMFCDKWAKAKHDYQTSVTPPSWRDQAEGSQN